MQNNTSTLHNFLKLAQTPKLNITRIKKLRAQFENIDAICNAPIKMLSQYLQEEQLHALKNPNHKIIDEALYWQDNKRRHILTYDDPRYPTALKEIANAPLVLFVEGDIDCLSAAQLAMVGSRQPSHSGLEIAEEFAYSLAQEELVITSGLALGIDTISHRGAIEANGKTIAVLGSGLSHLYPQKNRTLATSIIDQGCLISEYFLSEPPRAEHFPRRNRIISGLSLGTLVVEAALKSGSLITARYALEQNREVFAIPGSLRNPQSAGTLSLIQQGAKCVLCVNDILEELQRCPQVSVKAASDRTKPSLDPLSKQVLACIESEMTSIDQICARSKLTPDLVNATLLTLVLDGLVKEQYGGYVRNQRG